MFLSRFTLHPSLFSFLIPRNDSFMKVIDVLFDDAIVLFLKQKKSEFFT